MRRELLLVIGLVFGQTACREWLSKSDSKSDSGADSDTTAGAIPAEVFDGLKIITKQQLSAEMDERLAGASDSAKAEAQESFARIEQAMQQLNPSQILAAMNSLLYDDKMSSEDQSSLNRSLPMTINDEVNRNQSFDRPASIQCSTRDSEVPSRER